MMPDLTQQRTSLAVGPTAPSGIHKKGSQPARWMIMGIVALNSIGMSIVLPLLPFMVGQYLPPSQVVVGISALLSVFAGCTFFAAPALGALSDQYGRKPILLVSLLGSAIGYGLFGIGGALWLLFLGRILDGLTAGNVSTLYAYIADVTDSNERVKWYGYLGSAMSIGKIGGPALGGGWAAWLFRSPSTSRPG